MLPYIAYMDPMGIWLYQLLSVAKGDLMISTEIRTGAGALGEEKIRTEPQIERFLLILSSKHAF